MIMVYQLLLFGFPVNLVWPTCHLSRAHEALDRFSWICKNNCI